jgi:hypothetical protein
MILAEQYDRTARILVVAFLFGALRKCQAKPRPLELQPDETNKCWTVHDRKPSRQIRGIIPGINQGRPALEFQPGRLLSHALQRAAILFLQRMRYRRGDPALFRTGSSDGVCAVLAHELSHIVSSIMGIASDD